MPYTSRVFYLGSKGYAREVVTTQARADELAQAGWRAGELQPTEGVTGEGDVRVQDGHAYVDTP